MKTHNNNTDTIISNITSAVGGAVSLIRVSGNEAISLSNDLFPSKNLDEIPGGRFYFGKIEGRESTIDEVVVFIYRAPHSFSGEDTVEISCHANPFIIKEIINTYLQRGCRLAEPGEFTRRAFLNNKIDLTQAEAVADLISAKSKSAVKNSLRLLEGNLSEQIKKIKRELIDTTSLLELDLDFNEDDLEIISEDQIKKNLSSTIHIIEKFMKSFFTGSLLNKGVEVLISGKPNVGKSSLMNALLNKERVIVSHIPGTTRDVIHEDIIINDIMVRFIDSAGIYSTNNFIEAAGIEKARDLFEKVNMILLLADISEELTKEDINLIKAVTSIYKNKVHIVGNKIDLGMNKNTVDFIKNKELSLINISAKNNTNIEELKDVLIKKIVDISPEATEDIFITNERQYAILQKTMQALKQAHSGLDAGYGFEYIAIDLKAAIDHISEITGEITSDEILNNIFKTFCVGK